MSTAGLEVARAHGGHGWRWLPAAEAAGMFALIMLHIWVVSPRSPRAWLALPLLAIASHAAPRSR